MTKVLVLGAQGMLGHKMCHLLPTMGYEVFATIRKSQNELSDSPFFKNVTVKTNIDVKNDHDLKNVISEVKPHFIINCIGIVKQLPQASDYIESITLNALLPHKLAKICTEIGAKLIHFSTDCVFKGDQGDYQQDDVSDATDLYGRTKYLGETTTDEDAITIRSSIIGQEILGSKKGLIGWFLSEKGNEVAGFTRAMYTGFTTHEMVNICHSAMQNSDKLKGTYQIGSDKISKFDLLSIVNEKFNLNTTLKENNDFFCDRSLLTGNFCDLTGYKTPSWEEMIDVLKNENHLY